MRICIHKYILVTAKIDSIGNVLNAFWKDILKGKCWNCKSRLKTQKLLTFTTKLYNGIDSAVQHQLLIFLITTLMLRVKYFLSLAHDNWISAYSVCFFIPNKIWFWEENTLCILFHFFQYRPTDQQRNWLIFNSYRLSYVLLVKYIYYFLLLYNIIKNNNVIFRIRKWYFCIKHHFETITSFTYCRKQ